MFITGIINKHIIINTQNIIGLNMRPSFLYGSICKASMQEIAGNDHVRRYK